MGQHRGFAGGSAADQQFRPGGVDRGQEGSGVVGAVGQQQHRGVQQREQAVGEVDLVAVTRAPDRAADDGAEQAAGAGLDQTQQPHARVAGERELVTDPAQPAPVPVAVGNLDRVKAVECDRAQPAKHTPGVLGWPSGPATISNNALSGAGPRRRRSSRKAFSDTAGTTIPAPARPAVSLAHTRR